MKRTIRVTLTKHIMSSTWFWNQPPVTLNALDLEPVFVRLQNACTDVAVACQSRAASALATGFCR